MTTQAFESEHYRANGPGSGIERDADLWSAFARSDSAQTFCQGWLALQCRLIPGVGAALVLLEQGDGSFAPAAVWPEPQRDLSYLTEIAQAALTERRSVVLPGAPDGRADATYLGYPVDIRGSLFGVVVLDMSARGEADVQTALRQLQWGSGWLEVLFLRRSGSADTARLERATAALDILACTQDQGRLEAAAMAAASEIAARMSCERVAIGLERKGRIKLVALSHTAWFGKKTQAVAVLQNAMEEALDQNASVAFPQADPAPGPINVAHEELGEGRRAVLSVVMTEKGRPNGVITLEQGADQPFDAAAIALCEAVAALLGPALQVKADARRWFAGRIVDTGRDYWRSLVGPRKPGLKLATGLALAALGVLTFIDGDYRVSAKSVVEGAVQRAAAAPFEGFIAAAHVRAGETVKQGQVLATLEDKDLRLEANRWGSEREQRMRQYREALAKHDRAEGRILAAQVAQAESQLALAEEKLARTELIAPFDGIVVAGDLSQLLGSPVEQGKVLFEIAPLDAYRVILKVDERDIIHVTNGQTGELALSGAVGQRVPFRVKNVTPVSVAEEGLNYFRVEAELLDANLSVRPGMEGVGKIEVGERSLLWIWTHRFTDWVRLTLWTWLP